MGRFSVDEPTPLSEVLRELAARGATDLDDIEVDYEGCGTHRVEFTWGVDRPSVRADTIFAPALDDTYPPAPAHPEARELTDAEVAAEEATWD